MNENQTSSRRTPKRYRRHSTKRRSVFRPPAHPGRLIAIILAAVAVVTLALIWGNVLKRQSDAYRAAEKAGEWTLPPDEADGQDVSVPSVRAREISPQGNVGDIVISGAYGGVMLPLRDADGGLHYRSETATAAGISLSNGAPSLSEDVARIARRELRVTGIFHVTCFDADGTSMQTYLRGLELALLCEYASSGIDDLLLVGLPCGNDGDDALAVAFLQDFKALLSTVDNPPEVGVALPLQAIEGESNESGAPLYAGDMSPARIARVCDYLALDLRDKTSKEASKEASEVEALLPDLAYAYSRHDLRMMVSRSDPAVAESLLRHGFTRIFEMRTNES